MTQTLIHSWSGSYLTTDLLATSPGSHFNYTMISLSGLNLSTGAIYPLGIESTLLFGTPSISSLNTIYFQAPEGIAEPNSPPRPDGVGHLNVNNFGSLVIVPGIVYILPTSLVGVNQFGLITVLSDPIQLLSLLNVNQFGATTLYSFLPDSSLSTTVRSKVGLDLKLFNIYEAVPGLVEVVGYYDIDFTDEGDFELEDGMRTNLIMSLFCERRAEPYEVALPNMRRGWWGNETSDTTGFEIGSKLWLLDQSRLTSGTVSLSQQYAYKGMEWLVQDGLAASVSVTAAPQNLTVRPGIVLDIKITTETNIIEYKWYTLWGQTR